MAVELPKTAEMEYKGLKIGIIREGIKFRGYIKGKVKEQEVSAETEWEYGDGTSPSGVARKINKNLINNFDMIIPGLDNKFIDLFYGFFKGKKTK